jgi:uncharacterized protein (DUF885 family)
LKPQEWRQFLNAIGPPGRETDHAAPAAARHCLARTRAACQGRGLLSGDATSTLSGKLKALWAAYWGEELRRDPVQATYFGEHRYDDRLPDPSVEARTALVARHRPTPEAARALDPSALSADERIDREVLLFLLDDLLEGEPYRDFLIPLTQQKGLRLSFAQAANFHPTGTNSAWVRPMRR